MSFDSVKGSEKVALALLIIVPLACLLAYGQALSGPLFFDDVPNLLANNLVQVSGGTFDEWRVAAISSDAGLFYRPLAMLSFALNYVVSGEFTAFGLKATNLGIHLVNGGLIFLLTLALLRSPALSRAHPLNASECRMVAVLAAAIWLLHPIHVSTVLYAVQRMAQLSAMFTLAGLLVYTRYRVRWAEQGADIGEVIAAGLWLILLCLFAILSKENGALLLWLVAAVEVTLFQGRFSGQSRPALLRLGWLALCLPLLLLLGVVLVAPDYLPGRFSGREFSLQERLLTQGRALWQYLSWLAVPNIMDMGFFHDDIAASRSLWAPATTLVSLIAWALALGFAVLGHRRFPLMAFAILFFLVAHSMESSVLPLELVFEHRNYLPSVGIAVLAAVGIVRLASSFETFGLGTLAVALLAILALLLVLRAHAWTDELSLAEFNVKNHPNSARANFFYGNALFKRFQQADALGLGEDEKRDLAVASRSYFQRMHTINEREFAPLVMLYQIDTLFFPGLAQKNDWLGVMEVLVRDRRLQSSDRTALNALAAFAITPPGAHASARVGNLFSVVRARYPRNMQLLASHYRLLAAGGDAQRPALQAVLERAVEQNPNSRQAASYLAQFHAGQNMTNTYEAIRQWLQRDRLRREIGVLRGIFEN